MLIATSISVGEAATVINAIVAAIQLTLPLAIAAILIHSLNGVNSAMGWSVITRRVHSSLWPTILRAESDASVGVGARANFISTLSLISSILVILAGVLTPLGLSNGPLVQTMPKSMAASYVPDSSPLALATSPRNNYQYSRICGALGPMPCPGNGDDANTSAIAPYTLDVFSSTNHGPFNMQFRQFYNGTGGYNYSMLIGMLGMVQSFVLRDDIFVVDGLVVDLTNESPGIGLINHTAAPLHYGGTWSRDLLWIEPVTACVNTNLTVDYKLTDNNVLFDIETFNLTDRGGFANLTTVEPKISRDGQRPNVYQHAYGAAVLSNFYTMLGLNLTSRNESYIGKAYLMDRMNLTSSPSLSPGQMQYQTLEMYINNNNATWPDLDILCDGYGGADNANITNTGFTCSIFLSPPQRTDGGDPRLPADNSTWSQTIHACASTTRALIQNVQFSLNGSSTELDQMSITRRNTSSTLWAVEKSSLNITDVDLFWGQVSDAYENDTRLWTTRNEYLYIPAGGSNTWDNEAAGQPSTAISASWGVLGDDWTPNWNAIYSGSNNYALLTKYQNMLLADPVNGPAQITNLIWTDVVANNLVGSDTAETLFITPNRPSITYDLLYGIPLMLVLLIWLPMFLSSVAMFATRMLTFSQIRYFLNQTSAGRIITGASVLEVVRHDSEDMGRSEKPRLSDVLARHPKPELSADETTQVAFTSGHDVHEPKEHSSEQTSPRPSMAASAEEMIGGRTE